MESKYPKSEGVIFINNDKQKETHPDFRGKVEVSAEQIKMLIAMGRAGVEPTIQIAVWNRVSQAGAPYQYISAEVYFDPNKTAAPAPAQPAAPAFPTAPQIPAAAPAAPPPAQPAAAPAADEFDEFADVPF